MVLYGVVPECHRSVSGMVSECIMSAKMVSLSASGTVSILYIVHIYTISMITRMSSKFGQIRPLTAELAAPERLQTSS